RSIERDGLDRQVAEGGRGAAGEVADLHGRLIGSEDADAVDQHPVRHVGPRRDDHALTGDGHRSRDREVLAPPVRDRPGADAEGAVEVDTGQVSALPSAPSAMSALEMVPSRMLPLAAASGASSLEPTDAGPRSSAPRMSFLTFV